MRNEKIIANRFFAVKGTCSMLSRESVYLVTCDQMTLRTSKLKLLGTVLSLGCLSMVMEWLPSKEKNRSPPQCNKSATFLWRLEAKLTPQPVSDSQGCFFRFSAWNLFPVTFDNFRQDTMSIHDENSGRNARYFFTYTPQARCQVFRPK